MITSQDKNKAVDLTNLASAITMFPEEVLEREVVGIGNGAHINIPLKHKGKIAKIFIYPKNNVNVKPSLIKELDSKVKEEEVAKE